jgi:hypothetical protein
MEMHFLLLTSAILGLSGLAVFYKGRHFWLILFTSVVIVTSIAFRLWENLSGRLVGVMVISLLVFLVYAFLVVSIRSESHNYQLIREAIERATKKK